VEANNNQVGQYQNQNPNQMGMPMGMPQMMMGQGDQEEAGFDFWGVLNRRKWLVFLGLVSGLALGTLVYAKSETIYESVAAVKIEPRLKPTIRSRGAAEFAPEVLETAHDKLIVKKLMVELCLSRDNGKLKNLKSFDEIPKEDIADEVIENLTVTPDREAPYIYELSFHSTEKGDAPTILNNLLQTYEEHLIRQYENDKSLFVNELRKYQENFKNKFNVAINKRQEWENKYTSLELKGGTNIHEMMVVELTKSMQQLRSQLGELQNDRAMNERAAARGPEGIKDRIWTMQNNQQLLRDRPAAQRGVATASVRMRLLEATANAELIRQKVGTGHPEYEEAMAAVKIAEQQLADLEAENEEYLTDSTMVAPEVIFARMTADIDQNISDISRMIAEQDEQWNRHNTKAIELSKIQQEIRRIEEELTEIREAQRLGADLLVQLSAEGDISNSSGNDGYRFERLANALEGESVWPNLPLLLGLGGLLGSLLGFGLGCLVELADKTFHNPSEIIRQLNVPLIGHVPVIGQSKRYLVEGSAIRRLVMVSRLWLPTWRFRLLSLVNESCWLTPTCVVRDSTRPLELLPKKDLQQSLLANLTGKTVFSRSLKSKACQSCRVARSHKIRLSSARRLKSKT
jgi:capsular polysaccharide biosynthesis protein